MCDMSAWFTFRVYPAVAAHCLALSWQQMRLPDSRVTPRTNFDNLNDNTTLAVQIQTFG